MDDSGGTPAPKNGKTAVQTWIEPDATEQLDVLVASKKYRSRSHFVEVAILRLLKEEGDNGQTN